MPTLLVPISSPQFGNIFWKLILGIRGDVVGTAMMKTLPGAIITTIYSVRLEKDYVELKQVNSISHRSCGCCWKCSSAYCSRSCWSCCRCCSPSSSSIWLYRSCHSSSSSVVVLLLFVVGRVTAIGERSWIPFWPQHRKDTPHSGMENA